MRCPKCGYTGFDYLDSCKKCGGDLREARSLLQIIAVSPDQRGAMVGPSTAAPEEPRPAPDYGYAGPAAAADLSEFSSSAESGGGDVGTLSDLNFDESFADMVEPTSYSDAAPAPKPAPKSSKHEDEGLLDIDFGDVFGDQDEGKA